MIGRRGIADPSFCPSQSYFGMNFVLPWYDSSVTERIAISLDTNLLRAIERERKRLRISRSEFLRLTAKSYFDAAERKRLDDQYERAYREMPESRKEIAVAEAASADAFSDQW